MREDEKELLKFAAKAAGLSLDVSGKNGGANGAVFDLLGNVVLDWHNNVTWNPLKDDGDALRLAVKLRMDVGTYDEEGQPIACVVFCLNEKYLNFYEYHCDHPDANTTTRRAIVCAAAEIGRKM